MGWIQGRGRVGLALLAMAASVAGARAAMADELSMRFDAAADGLCFNNSDPELAHVGIPVLGSYGIDTGVCQGMSGLIAAFLEHARFDPSRQPPASDAEAAAIVNEIVRQHKGDCALEQVVPGYRNLKEFCQAHRRVFLRRAITYNAEIAVREIAERLPEFLYRRASAIEDAAGLARLDQEVRSLRARLEHGRAPLLLIYSHTLMVVSLDTELAADGRVAAVSIVAKDPNGADLLWTARIPYDANGLPAPGSSRMLWDVTPDRWTVVCWRR